MSFIVLPFLDSDAAHQMGVDVELFKMLGSQETSAIVRFYKISPPAITIGYHQSEESVVKLIENTSIDVVRRPTGGRAVLHLGDLTYSILGEVSSSFFGTSTLEIYHSISKGVKRGIEKLGIELGCQKESRVSLSPVCFQFVSRYELTYEGKKLTGGALLKRNGRFLFQGSILVDSPSEDYGKLSGSVPGLNSIIGRELKLEELTEIIRAGLEESFGVEIRHSEWPKGCLDKKKLVL